MNRPRVSLIVINWNTSADLRSCLRSAEETARIFPVETIVVDNASMDGSTEMVRSEFPSVRLIANSENLGFAGAVNQGLRAASGEYFLVLNADIVLLPDAVRRLTERMDVDPSIGAAMPELMNNDGSRQYGYVRRMPTVAQVLFFQTMLTPLASKSRWLSDRYLNAVINGEGTVDVEQIPGAFTLVRRSLVETVGGMEESFKLFFEDVDWSYRMKQAGHRLVMMRDIQCLHIGGASFRGPGKEWIGVRFLISLMHFSDRHHSFPRRFAIKTILLINALFATILRTVILPLFLGPRFPGALSSWKRNAMFLSAFVRIELLQQDLPLHDAR